MMMLLRRILVPIFDCRFLMGGSATACSTQRPTPIKFHPSTIGNQKSALPLAGGIA